MINFYRYYNKTGLDKEHYGPLITRLMSGIYPGELMQISHIIIKQPNHSYWYAKNILKGRWKEAEPIMMKEPYYAYQYAKDIIKSRWVEAESVIKTDKFWWDCYCTVFNIC